MQPRDIDEAFAFHSASPATSTYHAQVRTLLRETARQLVALTPPSDEQGLALDRLRDAMMYGNAAIAIHGAPGQPR
jgi:hypothetical protein